MQSQLAKKSKSFKPSTWAISNRTAMYIITVLISIYGLYIFLTLPKEQFPDIVVPTISVITTYAGNSPENIEKLITRPIEKQLKSISGAKVNKITSYSQQDYSLITVEFETEVPTDIAKQKVKDAVDRSKSDLPTDITTQPDVQEFSFSDLPILYVNVSGNYDQSTLKKYAKKLQDRFEQLPAVSKAELVGAPEREIQVNVNPIKMSSVFLNMDNIANGIKNENYDIGGGLLHMSPLNRNVITKGQFVSANDLSHIVLTNNKGENVYLKDIAQIIDTFKEADSKARLNGENVITLNIVKRAGENLIQTSDDIKDIVAQMQTTKQLPPNLHVVFSGDQSKESRTSFQDLINTIVIGFILVLVILMFFMGVTNAFFVALSVPLSIFVAFLFLPLGNAWLGTSITLNVIVLFALLFGLGIIVDDAIVVIENTHRIFRNGKYPIYQSAKEATGEIFIPVFAGTITTIAPFIPLLFWKGIIGKFMIYLPVVFILTLLASLVVAFIINPVFAVSFMKPEGKEFDSPPKLIFKKWWFYACLIIGLTAHILQWRGTGNLLFFIAILILCERFFLRNIIHWFQDTCLPFVLLKYEKLLRWMLIGWRPVKAFILLFVLFLFSIFLFKIRNNPIEFFPSGDPNNIYVYVQMPVSTQTIVTDSITQELYKKIAVACANEMPNQPNGIIESIISNVGVGVNKADNPNTSPQSNKGRIQISFVGFEYRHGKSTSEILNKIRMLMSQEKIPGALITVDKESNGPPTDPPVNIEISSNDFTEVAKTANQLYNYLNTLKIEGIEKLAMDVDLTNPQLVVLIDRTKATKSSLNTSTLGVGIRNAIFGDEATKLKDNEDEYKVMVRYAEPYRNQINTILETPITYRNQGTFAFQQVNLSQFTHIEFVNSTAIIKRKNTKPTIQIQSNLTNPYLAQKVNNELAAAITRFKNTHSISNDITILQTGASKQQEESSRFLSGALITGLLLIFMILVIQFNSLSKPFIVLTEIFFSIIGVILGFAITGMTISTIMVGIGIVGLAGIVVKNGILIIEFTDELRERGMRTKEAIVQAGKIRIIPVLLTALATSLGLIPLAIGLNINFVSLFQHLSPKLYFGGDSQTFWGPLSWTIIFGLIIAFFLTLTMVPSMYIMSHRLRRPMQRFYGTKYIALFGFTGPLFFILVGVMYAVRKMQGKKVWLG